MWSTIQISTLSHSTPSVPIINLWAHVKYATCTCAWPTSSEMHQLSTELEVTVGHWSFSDHFQGFGQANTICQDNFTTHFQWGQANDSLIPTFCERLTTF